MPIDRAMLLDQHRLFVELISRHAPLPSETLARHAGRLDWTALSENPRLEWSHDLLETYADRWDWPSLPAQAVRALGIDGAIAAARASRIPAARTIDAVVDQASFAACLAFLEAEDPSHVGDLLGLRDWPPDVHCWIADELRGSALDLGRLSRCAGFPWTPEFIEQHADELDWWALSHNEGLPWSLELLRTFEERWHWDWLCSWTPWGVVSEARPWTIALLDELGPRLEWFGGARSLADKVVWTPELFERHRNAIEAEYATLDGRNRQVPSDPHYWTYIVRPDHFSEAFVEHLLVLERQLERPTIDWRALCTHASSPWTPGFVARHQFRLKVDALLCNRGFPWSAHERRLAPLPANLRRLATKAGGRAIQNRLFAVPERIDWVRLENDEALRLVDIRISGMRWPNARVSTLGRIATLAELPLSTLYRDLPAAIVATLDAETIETFLRTSPRDRGRNRQLEAAIVASGDELDGYRIYADWLEEHGNAEHAAVLRALEDPWRASVERSGLTREFDRELAVLERFGAGWIVWGRGFVDKATLGRNWRAALETSAFGLVEALRVPGRHFTSPSRSAKLIVEDDWALLGSLPRLRRLAITDMKIRSCQGLARLEGLLDLDLAATAELVDWRGPPQVRRLCLAGVRRLDLRPLAELGNLVWLSLRQAEIDDPEPLRSCSSLVELDVRGTGLADVEPLMQLARLRKLHVDADGPISDADLGRLRRGNPKLEIVSGMRCQPLTKPLVTDAWFWSSTPYGDR